MKGSFGVLALPLTALALIPSAAHLFELRGKIGINRDACFTVHGFYTAWSMFAVVIIAAILANLALLIVERRDDTFAARWALASVDLIAVSRRSSSPGFSRPTRRR